MNRERALKAVLVVVGLLFLALIYPMMLFAKQEPDPTGSGETIVGGGDGDESFPLIRC
jgi:hypothetical protein